MFLWETWKAHHVMGYYLKHKFYEYPSIVVMPAWHSADKYVKLDDTREPRSNLLKQFLFKA
jgi:hypothetical protein